MAHGRNSREDVVTAAHRVLDEYGLGDLTMRRLATELDVRPSALYHHFPGKQALLAAVADRILGRVPLVSAGQDAADWSVRLRRAAIQLRDSLLACRDGAEVVATVQAYGLGEVRPADQFAGLLAAPRPDGAGLDGSTATVAARTLVFFVLGHTGDEQVHLQAGSAGAISDGPRAESDFTVGLDIVIAGIAAHARGQLRRW